MKWTPGWKVREERIFQLYCAVISTGNYTFSELRNGTPYADAVKLYEKYEALRKEREEPYAEADWTGADEKRMDNIGQNGNTGEHYGKAGE